MEIKKLKNNKYIKILFILVIIFTIYFFTFLLGSFTHQNKIIPSSNNKIITINGKNIEEFVTLNILGKSYKISIKSGDSVYKAMNELKNSNSNDFSFISKKYPGLGVFIESIDGRKGESGSYWIYYINNIKASVGVSNYHLKPGDIITWKQE